jgi:predicted acetyltransferase
MPIQLLQATIKHKPVLANLCELYAYDLTALCDFDIGDDGFYGYKDLPLYFTESTRFPYLIYVDHKIAGFILVQKGSPISHDTTVWDMAKCFVLSKYRRHGVGTKAVFKVWE